MSGISRKLMGVAKSTSGVATSLSYQDFASVNLTSTTRIFYGMGFGADEDDRYVLVLVHAFFNNVARDITSVSIGGVAATKLISTNSAKSTGVFAYCGLWVANPSGTSGDVVIIGSGSIDSWGASTWKLVTSNPIPTVTGEQTDMSAPISFTESYDAVSLFGSQGVNDTNATWTNATKVYGNDIRSNEWASAAVGNLIDTTGTVSVSLTDGAIFASWA